MKRKNFVTVFLAVLMAMSMSVTSFAAGWQKNDTGRWYGTNADNTAWHTNGWQWVDGNGDGVAECYYFDANGYILANTTTPDGYQVNADGAWVENGIVQTQGVSSGLSPQEIIDHLCKNETRPNSNGIVTLNVENGKVKTNKWFKDGWLWFSTNTYAANGSFAFALAVDENGYLMTNATTPDGYQTNEYGQLVLNGDIVTHNSRCRVLTTIDIYDKTGTLITDKNGGWPIDSINVSVCAIEISNYFLTMMPFGKLVYNHISSPAENQYEYGHNNCTDAIKSRLSLEWTP